MSERLNDLIEGALDWAAAGVPVFPCKADKSPLTENGHLDATTDESAIRRLFEFFGDAAVFVGARMGKESGLFAVDLDTYKDDVEAYAKGLRDQGLLPDTRTHKTKSGGLHLIYRGNEQPNCKPHSGVEVKGEGGYIIVPPSPGYEALTEGVKEAPRGLLAHFAAARAARAASTNDQLEANILKGTDFHESLIQLAARYAQRGHSQTEIQRKLMDTMQASVAASPHHPRHARWASIIRDQGEEFTRAIRSANAKYNDASASEAMRDQVQFDEGLANAAGFFMEQNLPEDRVETFDGSTNPFEGMGYYAHEKIDVENSAFTMWPIYAENETVVIFAEPKTGKTALALSTALCISAGRDFGTFKVVEAGPTLYYGLEGRRAIELRVESWKRHEADEGRPVPEHLPMFTVTAPANFLREDNRKTEANRIIAYNSYVKEKEGTALKAIFIDTLTKAMTGGDQNSVEDTSHLFDLVSLLRDAGITATIIFVHHKSRTGGVRGSTNIEAEPDVLLDVSKEGSIVTMGIARARSIEDGQRYLFRLKGYDLGKTDQGFTQAGLVVEPADVVEDDASAAMVDSMEDQKRRTIIIEIAVDGYADAQAVATEWHRQGLVGSPKQKTVRVTNKDFQAMAHDVVPDREGCVFGKHALRLVKNDRKVVGFEVSALT